MFPSSSCSSPPPSRCLAAAEGLAGASRTPSLLLDFGPSARLREHLEKIRMSPLCNFKPAYQRSKSTPCYYLYDV